MQQGNEEQAVQGYGLHNITIKAVLLTLGYGILWALGPIIFTDNSAMIVGLPAWFWFSCVFSPLILVVASYMLFFRR